MAKRFAVLGLGRFGARLAEKLVERGGEVIAADNDMDKVSAIQSRVTIAVQLDCTDEKALRSQGIDKVDVAIVTMGDNFEANVLTTMLLKDMGVKKVLARCAEGVQTRILQAVGADRVIHPEEEVAVKVAENLTVETIIDYLAISPNVQVAQIQAPSRFWGKSIGDIGLGRRFHLTCVAIRRGETDVDEVPEAGTVIEEGDTLIVVGKPEAIQRAATLDQD